MIADNLKRLLESIERAKLTCGAKRDIQLIAVSKYSGIDEIKEARDCGQILFGENKVQDLVLKASALDCNIKWHFIGVLQENKINALLKVKPDLVHSLHSRSLALALQKRLDRNNQFLDCLLQINISNEASKSGFALEEARSAYLEIMESCPNIRLKGLMTIGSNVDDSRIIRRDFTLMRDMFDSLSSHGASILSMGMSKDYKIAIECGSNCLRIGGYIFKGF